MSEPSPNPEPVVYQLRIVLRGVSPLIWRRLLVRSDSTIADLHATFQLALGWSDEHLNRFVTTITRSHARLAAGCRPALPGGIGYPLGSHARFQSSLHLILSAQASLAHNGGFRAIVPC